jgi:plasmid stabilization system protein ParE
MSRKTTARRRISWCTEFTDSANFTRPNLRPGLSAIDFKQACGIFRWGSYVVFYRPEDDGLVVVRVLHGARNIEELFRA